MKSKNFLNLNILYILLKHNFKFGDSLAVWKIVVSNPENRKSYQIEVDQSKAVGLSGKKIGEEFEGDLLGLVGYTLKITGGTDKDGFPMHPSVRGMGRKKVLLAGLPGFHPKLKGQRKRKMVRGDVISTDLAQINVKVVKKGVQPLEQLLPSKKKEEKPKGEKEEVKPEAKEEKKPEGKKVEEKKAEPVKEEKKTKKLEEEQKSEEKPKEEKIGGEKVQEEKK